jgi:sRNA-binding protein
MTASEIRVVLVVMAEWFPLAFTVENYLPHRPLKIGINADLATSRNLSQTPAHKHGN